MKNPYKRIKEIDAELEALEETEKAYNKIGWKKNKPRKLEDVESSIMFLCFEKKPIEETIEYFEKKYPELTLSTGEKDGK